jgi:phage terminase small subunit
MGKRGPAPKPTEIKKLQGNPGEHALNDAEPQFEPGAKMPLLVQNDPVARAEWERRVPELLATHVLTRQDETEFAEYCLQHSICNALWKEQESLGFERAIMAGIFKARQTAVATRTRLAAKFGFTPSDRSQVKIPKNPANQGGGKFLTGAPKLVAIK